MQESLLGLEGHNRGSIVAISDQAEDLGILSGDLDISSKSHQENLQQETKKESDDVSENDDQNDPTT